MNGWSSSLELGLVNTIGNTVADTDTGRRVLVVEADACAAEALAAELRGRGHGVVAIVDTTAEAIATTVRSLTAQAATDPLTGLANRRSLDDTLRREWSRCGREQLPLALLVVDVDRFKAFNDTVGHQAGDACLAAIAEAARLSCRRPGSVACRWGGDEFLIVLPATDLPTATSIADDILAAVRGLPPHVAAADRGSVTVSIGVTAATPSPEREVEALVAAADRAMYAAKESGRDCRTTASP